MWDLIYITLIAILFNHLGLAEKVTFGTKRNVVINCSKCLTFWTTTGYSLFYLGQGITLSLFTGFSLAYAALWIELLLNVLNYYYEKCYGKIYSEAGETDTEQTDKMPEL